MSQEERQNELVTEIDVLFGEDRPWYGFERVEGPALQGQEEGTEQSVWLTFRRGVKRESMIMLFEFESAID